MAERLPPWRELRRRAHVHFRLARLPAGVTGVCWPRGDRTAVIIDIDLDRRHRRAALAHELIHEERGGGCHIDGMPDTWRAVVTRDEMHVDAEVARWLVPLAELAEFCEGMAEISLGVTAADVAEQFDVPEEVAHRALCALSTPVDGEDVG